MTSIELSIQELVEMLRITPVNQEYIYIHAFGGRVPNPGKPCDGENKVKDLRFAKKSGYFNAYSRPFIVEMLVVGINSSVSSKEDRKYQ